ncbi:6599_t:CDS:1 [Racocetra fulgida]|uniref:6599_t:CDS:1 n=1 Tax=Racocetra fulgida TaxID=60492 RepID=A0A9N9NFI3_9GLOM|nr:6599_t:CDS:1 [Racocetra fulgida]
MTFIKNIIKKIKTISFKKEKTFEDERLLPIRDDWKDCFQDIEWRNYLSSSIVDKEDFFQASEPTVEREKQFITKIKIDDYIIFTRYEDFRNYLVDQNLINPSLKIYYETSHKRLNNILSWIEFHVRSTFYGWNEGYNFHYVNNTLDLLNDVNKRNIEIIDKYLFEVNEYVKKFNVKYLWSWTDLEEYNKKFLAY